METLETLEEESFEYNGPVSRCKGGGGSTTTTEYVQSPEQREIYQAVLPTIQQISARGAGGAPLWDVGNIPNIPRTTDTTGLLTGVTDPSAAGVMTGVPMPSMEGVLTGVGAYGIPEAVMPSTGWYQDIAPEVMAGIQSPYVEASEAMMGRMEQMGQLGTARGGVSGGAGAALGEFAARSAKDIGMQAWQMTAPQLMQRRQEMLAQNIAQREEMQRERMGDWESMTQMAGLARQERQADFATLGQRAGFERQERMMGWESEQQRRSAQLGLETEAWRQRIAEQQLPYMILPGLAGGAYSTPVVTQQGGGGGGGSVGGAMSGAAGGALAGSAFGPWGTAGGAIIGGVGGAMGGK